MKAETEPITPDEILVRLIWQNDFKDNGTTIEREAFQPKKRDTDGISLFRLACLTSLEQALEILAEKTRAQHHLGFLRVKYVQSLGLSVKSDPILEPVPIPGHVILPEMNRSNFDADRPKLREVMDHLAGNCKPSPDLL